MTGPHRVDFEARYRAEGDPWDYATSPYEQAKYAHTLDACGNGPFVHALELGGSIGLFTALLAARCRRLTSIDLSPTAVAMARRRLAPAAHVRCVLGVLPGDLPDGWFDLVVASEILYYLEPSDLAATLAALRARVAPGGRLVAVHWRPAGPERPFDAETVHTVLAAQSWLAHRSAADGAGSRGYRLDVFEAA